MKKLKWFILSVFLLSVIAGVIVYVQIIRSPQYSLKQALCAIQTHDSTTFEKYVNIDKVLDRAVGDWFEAETKKDLTSGKLTKESADMAIGLAALVKAPLIDTLKQEIISQIETLPSTPSNSNNIQGENRDTNLSAAKNLLENSYKGIKYIKKEGTLAKVGLSFDTPKKEDLVVELLMKQQHGYWQIIAISNILEVVNKANDKIIETNILTTGNGGFGSYYNNVKLCATSDQFDKQKDLLSPYLYRTTDISELSSFILTKVENKNALAIMQSAQNSKRFLSEMQNEMDEKSKAYLLSPFNNNFTRAYLYFRNTEGFSHQESVDQAYIQAYRSLIIMINNPKTIVKYLDEMNQFYNDENSSRDDAGKCIFVQSKELVAILDQK